MVIKFRKKSTSESLILLILLLPFAFGLLLELLRLPTFIRYILDIAWLILLFMMALGERGFPHAEPKTAVTIVVLFLTVGFFGFVFNYQSILYFLWGIRNSVRFFVYFFACIMYLRSQNVKNYLQFFECFFGINFVVVLYQYFVLDKSGDYLGGIFGVQRGCNGYLSIFLFIITTYSVLKYMMGEEPFLKCGVRCAVALIISVLSELKIFVVMFIAIILLASSMTKFSVRKIYITLGCAVGIVLAARGIAALFPDFADWFHFDSMMEIIGSEDGYTGRGDLNRLTYIPIVWNEFLPGIWQKLFGKGLGNCDYASFAFLTSPFYNKYKWLNYTYFSGAMLILETGILGLFLNISYFVSVYLAARRMLRKNGIPLYCYMTQILTILSVVLLAYGNAMRSEPAYIMYFVLALPFIRQSPEKKSREPSILPPKEVIGYEK